MPSSSDQQIPAGIADAEKAFIATALRDNDVYRRVCGFLQSGHFTQPIHSRIYTALCRSMDVGNPVGVTELKLVLSMTGDTAGADYLESMESLAVSAELAEACGRRIHDGYLRRALIGFAENIIEDTPSISNADERSALDLIGQAEAKLYDLALAAQTESSFETFKETLIKIRGRAEAAHTGQGKPLGLRTGLIDLDDKLNGGLKEGQLVILAGRPSMGTTALAINIAFNAAHAYKGELYAHGSKKCVDGAITAFFSPELSSEQLGTRILARQAELYTHMIRLGELSSEEFERLVAAAQNLDGLPLFIDDSPALSISELCTRARQLKRRHGLGLIIVDDLQNVRGSCLGGSRKKRISEVTRGLKILARELSVPIIATSRLSRAVEKREDKRPRLTDLRGSGAVLREADVVMFVFREQYYLERAEPDQRPDEGQDQLNERHAKWEQRCEEVWNTAEVIIAKQRHGPVGTVRLSFHGLCDKFDNLDL